MFACCGFAIFLLHQLLLPFTRLRMKAPGDIVDSAVAWRPGNASTSTPARPHSRRPALTFVVGLEVVALGASFGGAFLLTRPGAIAGPSSFEVLLQSLPLCGDSARVP